MTVPVKWYAYRTSKTVHAFRPGAPRSVCGRAWAVRRTGRGSTTPPPDHACSLCSKRLRADPTPSPTTEHREDIAACACASCRARRSEEASAYASETRKQVHRSVCRCVQQWPGTEPIVRDAETEGRAAPRLGDDRSKRRRTRRRGRRPRGPTRVGDAETQYECLDGRHPLHGSRKQR